MNVEYSIWNSWPLGNAPPVHYDPPVPGSTYYEDDGSSLPIPFDLIAAASNVRHAADILAVLRERQRSIPTRKNFQVTDEHPRIVGSHKEHHNGNLGESPEQNHGKDHEEDQFRESDNNLHPQMGKGGSHIPGAFPDNLLRDADIPYPILSIPEEQRGRMQPTIENSSDGVKPNQPAITPLMPDFLIPSKPPSPILPRATEPNNTLGPTEIKSMWHNYCTSLDRAGEARAINFLRKSGYTVTKRSARGILRHKKESSRRQAAQDDLKEPWYMYHGDTGGAESTGFRHRKRQADQHGVHVSNSVEPETQSRVQPSKPAVTQKHASRRTRQYSSYNSSYVWRPLFATPRYEGVAKPTEEINAADTELRPKTTEQKKNFESRAEVPTVMPQAEATGQGKKIKSTNATDVSPKATEKIEQPRIRFSGYRRPIPEVLNISELRRQNPDVAFEEWQAKLASEKERGLRLDKKCGEFARLTKEQHPKTPSTADLRRISKLTLDKLRKKREEAEQRREAELKKAVKLQSGFKVLEVKLPETKLAGIQSPETNLPKDASSPSSPILSPVIYFRNTEPHSEEYMMSGGLPFEYVDVDMEDARSLV